MRQYLIKKKLRYIEYPFKSKSGNIIWLAQSNNIIIEDNKVVGFDLIARDITEKKTAEIQLNERNEFIEMVLENIQTGLVACKIETDEIIYSNKKFEEILGYKKEQMKFFYPILDQYTIQMKIIEKHLKVKI